MHKDVHRNRFKLPITASALAVSLLCFGLHAQADSDKGFLPVYVGGNLGLSDLSPASGTAIDSSDHAVSLQAGYDFNDAVSVEISVSDLGSAQLSSGEGGNGSVSYSDAGVSVLVYGFRQHSKTANKSAHEGFAVYARLGANHVEADYSQSQYSDSSDTEIMAGVGAEYGWENGLGARAELSIRSDEVKTVNFGLVKRFRSKADEAMAAATQQATKRLATAEPLWSNRLSIVFPTIHLDSIGKQGKLNREQQTALDELATALKRHDSLELVVRGHSDPYGSTSEKLRRSRDGAILVSRFLQSKGIRGNRLHLRSYGDTKPYSLGGRRAANNKQRRVDFDLFSRG